MGHIFHFGGTESIAAADKGNVVCIGRLLVVNGIAYHHSGRMRNSAEKRGKALGFFGAALF